MILLAMVAVTKVMGLVYKLMLTNLLGGTGMAVYSSVYAAFTPVFAIAIGGIPSAVAIMVSESFALARYKNARRIRHTAMLIFTLSGAVCCVLIMLLSGVMSDVLLKSDAMKAGLIAAAPTVAFCCVISVYRGYFEGLCDMVPTAVSEIIESVLKLILGLLFAYAAFTYASPKYDKDTTLALTAAASVLGVSMSSLFAAIYLFIHLRLRGDGISEKMLLSDRCCDSRWHISKELLRYSFPIALTAAISTLINTVDLVTVPRMLTLMHGRGLLDITGSVGISDPDKAASFIFGSYTALALTVTGIIPGFTAMLGKPALPEVSRARAANDIKALKKGLGDIFMLSSLIAFPASFGMTAFSKELLLFLFPSRTAEAAAACYPTMIMSAGLVFGCFLPPLFALLQAAGSPSSPVRIMIVSCLVKLIGNIIFMSVPRLGVSGAAMSLVVSDMAAFMLGVHILKKCLPVRTGILKCMISPAFCSLLCAAAARLSYDKLFVLSLRPRLMISVMCGGIIYIFSLYLLNIMPKNGFGSENFKKFAKKT